jgi:hypothetical protein
MTNKTAIIKIMKPLSFFDDKYIYQEVPLHALDERLVYIKKGASGNKMISTKNIKLLKVFNNDDRGGIEKYLDGLRNGDINESIGMKKVIKGYLNENIGNNPIEEVFKNNPELSNIGNVEQYSKYLETIFPDSKVKDIVYHSSPNRIENFRDAMFGTYFSYSPIKGVYGSVIHSVILNTKNPLVKPKPEDATEVKIKYDKEYRNYNNPSSPHDASIEGSTVTEEGTQIRVKNPKQIHILGSKQDIEGFKKYVEVNNVNENIKKMEILSESLKHHLSNGISINESVFRPGSEAHIDLLVETRELYEKGLIELNDDDEYLFETTDIGRFGTFRGEVVPLDVFLIEYDGGKYEINDEHDNEIDVDFIESYLKERGWGDLPYERFIDFENSEYYTGTVNSKTYAREMNKYLTDISRGIIDENIIEESKKKKKKHPPLGKIRRNSGSGKKYVVYVKNPSTGKIKKITFGDKKGGLRAKTGNSKARKSFAARHNCAKKKDRMTAGYWACRLTRSGLFGKNKTTSGYW